MLHPVTAASSRPLIVLRFSQLATSRVRSQVSMVPQCNPGAYAKAGGEPMRQFSAKAIQPLVLTIEPGASLQINAPNVEENT